MSTNPAMEQPKVRKFESVEGADDLKKSISKPDGMCLPFGF